MDASGIFFVVGVERKGIMGEPALSYRSKAAAEKAVENFGGRILTFIQLREENRK